MSPIVVHLNICHNLKDYIYSFINSSRKKKLSVLFNNNPPELAEKFIDCCYYKFIMWKQDYSKLIQKQIIISYKQMILQNKIWRI